jgi:hypothetical protein
LLIYEIAFHLKLPLYELLDKMPYTELLGWSNYFDRRPVGWREDNRAYQLMRAQGVKEKPEAIFESLAAIRRNSNSQTEPDRISNTFKNSYLYQKLMTAKAGEKVS